MTDIILEAEDLEQNIDLGEEMTEEDIDIQTGDDEEDIDVLDEASVVNLDYNKLRNKPRVNGVTLIDDKSFEELGVEPMTNQEILDTVNRVFGGS